MGRHGEILKSAMNFFEVKRRLRNLRELRALMYQYVSFTNRSSNPAAQILKDRIDPLLPMALESLKKANLGRIETSDAPACGGKRVSINVVISAFRDSVMQHYNLNDDLPLQALDDAILHYEKHYRRSRLQLFNPLYWIMQIVGLLASSPFSLLRLAGIESEKFENSWPGRLLKVAFVLLMVFLIISITVLWS
jgi:hypothetical protein